MMFISRAFALGAVGAQAVSAEKPAGECSDRQIVKDSVMLQKSTYETKHVQVEHNSPPKFKPSCTKGDVKSVCKQLGDGGTWNNTDLTAWYGCLAENCMDQTDLWDGATCDEVLQMLKCHDPADMSGHHSDQQLTKFVGTVGDACPRSCKPKCRKCEKLIGMHTHDRPDATATLPVDCSTCPLGYNDGCNDCQCINGQPACTKKLCSTPKPAFCPARTPTPSPTPTPSMAPPKKEKKKKSSCTKGDAKTVCKQLGEGGTWNNADLTAWYGCLAENCIDQMDLWDGVTCDEALQTLKCHDPADMSGHQSDQQITQFVGTVGDACPRSCKPKCKKCQPLDKGWKPTQRA